MSSILILLAVVFGGMWIVYKVERMDWRKVEVDSMALRDRDKQYQSPRRYHDWHK